MVSALGGFDGLQVALRVLERTVQPSHPGARRSAAQQQCRGEREHGKKSVLCTCSPSAEALACVLAASRHTPAAPARAPALAVGSRARPSSAEPRSAHGVLLQYVLRVRRASGRPGSLAALLPRAASLRRATWDLRAGGGGRSALCCRPAARPRRLRRVRPFPHEGQLVPLLGHDECKNCQAVPPPLLVGASTARLPATGAMCAPRSGAPAAGREARAHRELHRIGRRASPFACEFSRWASRGLNRRGDGGARRRWPCCSSQQPPCCRMRLHGMRSPPLGSVLQVRV